MNHSPRQAISCTNHFHNTTIFCENSLTSQYSVVVHVFYMLTQIVIAVVYVETVVAVVKVNKFLMPSSGKISVSYVPKSHLAITCYFSVTRHNAVTLFEC